MKAKNKRKKLRNRIAEWEAIRHNDLTDGGKVKLVNKSAFRKPGSNSK